ncbi:hypothetical protein [Micromonospora sp. RTGN7]|uniref:hypothetical protein n=1 Tax=Micromonospora sp. RTGN7 TaxID=3016526 RepID=UPI0029FF4521|nr:hypothetical protein [Micromonospora sp. RTGN7]
MESQLERENGLVLDAMQASLGLISAKIHAVSVAMEAEVITMHFAVAYLNVDAEEGIDDILFELDALRGGTERIESSVHVGFPDGGWSGRSGRLFYLAKEVSEYYLRAGRMRKVDCRGGDGAT